METKTDTADWNAINDQIDLAGVEETEATIQRFSPDYCRGVMAALRWALGYEDAPPPMSSSYARLPQA